MGTMISHMTTLKETLMSKPSEVSGRAIAKMVSAWLIEDGHEPKRIEHGTAFVLTAQQVNGSLKRKGLSTPLDVDTARKVAEEFYLNYGKHNRTAIEDLGWEKPKHK